MELPSDEDGVLMPSDDNGRGVLMPSGDDDGRDFAQERRPKTPAKRMRISSSRGQHRPDIDRDQAPVEINSLGLPDGVVVDEHSFAP